MTIRKAQLGDVPTLFEMINHYAAEKVMLPRTLADLYENVWEFTVDEENGQILGCGALKLYSSHLAEVRSLCVAPGLARHGVGRRLLESVLAEAEAMRLKTVFAMTLAPEFFQKFGFQEVPRETLFMKVWRDCLRCDRHSRCQEKAFVLDLAARGMDQSESAAEPAEILSD
jgi:amino-acid N-acetyltransferase